MMENTIRIMTINEFDDIFNRIEKDFAAGEYAPRDILCQQLEKGIQDGLIFVEGDHDVAYSICATEPSNKYVLLSYLGVFEEFRGLGIGTTFLKELGRIYSDKQGIIVEVEKPENSSNQEEKTSRLRRIEFYHRAGFRLVPNIEYSIWDIPMHLMVLTHPEADQAINKRIGQIMYEIYLGLMGKRYIHQMKFKYIG